MKAFNLETALQDPAATRELHIHGLVLSNFPQEILQLKQLRKLALTRNQLDTIPEEIAQLSALEELVLDDNRLSSLPQSLAKISSLKKISLRNNNLTQGPTVLWACRNLQVLQLTNNRLEKLADALGLLSKLQILCVAGNQLESLPTSLGKLAELEVLSAANNQLKKLPQTIGNCKHLQTINLRKNALRKLPIAIANLKALRVLTLDENPLRHFPEALLYKMHIEELSLQACKLKTLPTSLSPLVSLRKLNLAENKIVTLPDTIVALKYLDTLVLDNNKLSRLPKTIASLARLRSLAVAKNPLTVLPDDLFQLRWLNHLSIKGTWSLSTTETITAVQAPLLAAQRLLTAYEQAPTAPKVQMILQFLRSLIYFVQLDRLEISAHYLTKSQVQFILKFIKMSRQETLSTHLRLAFFQLALGEKFVSERLDSSSLWKALSFKHITVRKTALSLLKKQYRSVALPLEEGSHLLFLGKTPVNTTAIKQRLARIGVQVSNTYEANFTHVVLGAFPAMNAGEQLLKHAAIAMVEPQAVMQFLSTQESKDWGEEELAAQQRITQLLLSSQSESIALALQLLKRRPLDTSLITDLFIAYKTIRFTQHKNAIRRLLDLYLNEASREVLRTLDWKKMASSDLDTQMSKVLANSLFDLQRIRDYLQNKRS